jgi:SAM-dependent methyltransferase
MSDTEQHLRAAYAADGGSRAVFSAKVTDYMASRPDYPEALFDLLVQRCPPAAPSQVVDLGAGTGLFTQGLLARGYPVLAVEPNPAMRAAADARLGSRAGYRSAEGSAEAVPLPDRSVNLITAAHAFHWFEIDATRRECQRLLVPGGLVALVWNDRVLEDPLHRALDAVHETFGGEQRDALLANEARFRVASFFEDDSRFESFWWPHEQTLDSDGFTALVFSRSYMPLRHTDAGRQVAADMRRLFEAFAHDDRVIVRYRSKMTIGSLGPSA